ncbi:hypothetical protein GQ53DRAFT_669381 [Thozetella sp. PMI_491]|nr:hypothetical protein GQ53DRAFT_669381 [Thozetella sp. PMI_491]
MGRRPNALILQWFTRGPKLKDNSNRYPHTCKACGEHYPKGRHDSLVAHLTKKCPAISEAERMALCLNIGGFTTPRPKVKAKQKAASEARQQANGVPIDPTSLSSNEWAKLNALAEVSKQERKKLDDQGIDAGMQPQSLHGNERFEIQEQFALENPPLHYEQRQGTDKDNNADLLLALENSKSSMTEEEKLQEALRSEESPEDSTNLSMAAAAAARVHHSLVDPELIGEDVAVAHGLPIAVPQQAFADLVHHSGPAAIPTTSAGQPWGEITYATEPLPPLHPPMVGTPPQAPTTLIRGGFRLDTSPANGSKGRHSRAKFNPERRKEVQEVRKLGACIRCRILRKTCSMGDPCDTCKKVLSPRVWNYGCVRTNFIEQFDMYSAGVQVVLAQSRVNDLKTQLGSDLKSNGLTIEASHFPEIDTRLYLKVLEKAETAEDGGGGRDVNDIIMIDTDTQDVAARVEVYMRELLPELVKCESSHFALTTLRAALDILAEKEDDVLRKAVELWGLVELLGRERQWTICVPSTSDEAEPSYLKDETHPDIFHTICLQLSAAAERKAAATSKSLLMSMQRLLQDSKSKVDSNMYFATLILLNCVEKSTWVLKAWEQEHLKQGWPLPQKQPSAYTSQGYAMAGILRVLLSIRKVLPQTKPRQVDGVLVVEGQDERLFRYFEYLNFYYDRVKQKQNEPSFNPSDPRSLELMFCSTLLLPDDPEPL